MAVLFLLGWGSGLPYYLTANTLQAWLASVQLDLATIATFNAIGLAYTLKFLWAPVSIASRCRGSAGAAAG